MPHIGRCGEPVIYQYMGFRLDDLLHVEPRRWKRSSGWGHRRWRRSKSSAVMNTLQMCMMSRKNTVAAAGNRPTPKLKKRRVMSG